MDLVQSTVGIDISDVRTLRQPHEYALAHNYSSLKSVVAIHFLLDCQTKSLAHQGGSFDGHGFNSVYQTQACKPQAIEIQKIIVWEGELGAYSHLTPITCNSSRKGIQSIESTS